MNSIDAYNVFKDDSCLFNKDTRTLYVLDRGEDGNSLNGVVIAKLNADNSELVSLINKYEAACYSMSVVQKPKDELRNLAILANKASVDPLDNTVNGVEIGSKIQFEFVPFEYPDSLDNPSIKAHEKQDMMDTALIDYCNHLETDHHLTHMVTDAQFLAEIYTEKSSLNYEVVLDELNSLERSEEKGLYFNTLSSLTKNFFKPNEDRESVTKVSLDDVVEYGYFDENDGMSVQKSMSVKEMIDYWYGQRNNLGHAYDKLTGALINGKVYSSWNDVKCIKDLMKDLVEATSYVAQYQTEFNKIPKERRDEYLAAGITSDDIVFCLKNDWRPDEITKGYIVAEGGSDFDIPNALQIKPIDDLGFYENDFVAREQAARDGIALINDIPDLEKGAYIDTPENRKICIDVLESMPELRIYNVLNHPCISPLYRDDYINKYGDPRVEMAKEYDTVNESSGMTKKDISTSDNKIVEEVPKPKELANELLGKMASAGYSIEDVQKHMAELQKSVKDIMFKNPEMKNRLKDNERMASNQNAANR